MTNTPTKCEFCGRELQPLYSPYNLAGKMTDVLMGHEKCQCEQAVLARVKKEQEERAEEEKRAYHERLRRYEQAGIPPKYQTAKADVAYGIGRVLAGKGLYLEGDNGTTKTTYAAALAMAVIDRGKTVVFTSSSRMKGELFSTSSKRNEEDLFRRWSKPYLLVIDDLGKECANKAVVPMLYRVINERDEQLKPVVVTSNFSKNALGEKLAECGDESCAQAIVSRLFGMTEKMQFNGEDRRLW